MLVIFSLNFHSFDLNTQPDLSTPYALFRHPSYQSITFIRISLIDDLHFIAFMVSDFYENELRDHDDNGRRVDSRMIGEKCKMVEKCRNEGVNRGSSPEERVGRHGEYLLD